jgi:hypothetical protein
MAHSRTRNTRPSGRSASPAICQRRRATLAIFAPYSPNSGNRLVLNGEILHRDATVWPLLRHGLLDDPLALIGDRIIFSERDIGISPKALAIWFPTLYRDLGFKGASSHRGRRTGRQAMHRWRRQPARCSAAGFPCCATINMRTHIAAFENAPQPGDRCLIQMFPNHSFCRARLARWYRYHQFISRRHGDPPHPRLRSRISVGSKLDEATAQYPGAFLARQCASHPDCRATGFQIVRGQTTFVLI